LAESGHALDHGSQRRRGGQPAGGVQEMAAAPVDHRGLAQRRLASCEVLRIDHAAGRGDVGDQQPARFRRCRNRAAGLGQPLQRRRQIAEAEEAGLP
jgi:hypothetical protein